MNKENNKLGMGLGALLSSKKNEAEGLVVLNLSQIEPNKQQPRHKFDQKELEELASSIKTQGLIQPIIVKKLQQDSYEIIAGERRWRAAQIAGLHEIDCVIKDYNDIRTLKSHDIIFRQIRIDSH